MSNADPLPEMNRGRPYVHATDQFIRTTTLTAKLYVNNDTTQDLLAFVELPAIPQQGDTLQVMNQFDVQDELYRILQVLEQYERPPVYGPDRKLLSLVVEKIN